MIEPFRFSLHFRFDDVVVRISKDEEISNRYAATIAKDFNLCPNDFVCYYIDFEAVKEICNFIATKIQLRQKPRYSDLVNICARRNTEEIKLG